MGRGKAKRYTAPLCDAGCRVLPLARVAGAWLCPNCAFRANVELRAARAKQEVGLALMRAMSRGAGPMGSSIDYVELLDNAGLSLGVLPKAMEKAVKSRASERERVRKEAAKRAGKGS